MRFQGKTFLDPAKLALVAAAVARNFMRKNFHFNFGKKKEKFKKFPALTFILDCHCENFLALFRLIAQKSEPLSILSVNSLWRVILCICFSC